MECQIQIERMMNVKFVVVIIQHALDVMVLFVLFITIMIMIMLQFSFCV